jgi:PadR family transcriptional regulator, regulatory protein AphA
MSLDHAILGFLREQAMSGYDLKNVCFDRDAHHFWTADQAQVYRTLDRLERRGLVTARRERQRSRPDRRVYSITRAGERELDAWVGSPFPLPPLRDPFLIQLRFATEISDAELASLLRARRGQLQERLDSLRARAAATPPAAGRTADLERLTLEAAMADARASIDWLDDTLETLPETDAAPDPVVTRYRPVPRPATEGST